MSMIGNYKGSEAIQEELKINAMITEFKDYRELPFPEVIQKELFNRHTHGELAEPEEIVYTEKDVLILLQMLQEEIKKAG